MKTAYSMLLGEYVRAAQVEHADTTGFQIVCPCCRDAVFKVLRPNDGTPIEYFAHHKQSKEVVADCELRVAGISSEMQASTNADSRGQTLKAFQGVLREALALDPIYMITRLTAEQAHRELQSASGIKYLQDVFADWMIQETFKDGVETFVDNYIGNMVDSGLGLSTAFSLAVQRRIAIDLARHLTSPSVGRSRRFVVAHAILLGVRSHLSAPPAAVANEAMVALHETYAGLKNSTASSMSSLLAHQKRGMFLVASLEHEVLGALLRLPYQEMLRNHRAGLPMLDGIEPEGADNWMGMRPA